MSNEKNLFEEIDIKENKITSIGTPVGNTFNVQILVDKFNPKKGYRIYHYADTENDRTMIEELQKRQSKIKRTTFPTGILLQNGKIIGQVMPFFQNTTTVVERFIYQKGINPISTYIEILKSIREMYNNGIMYTDIHGANFLMEESTGKIETIDFESKQVFFDNTVKQAKIVLNFTHMLSGLNQYMNVQMPKLRLISTLEEISEYLQTLEYKTKIDKKQKKR